MVHRWVTAEQPDKPIDVLTTVTGTGPHPSVAETVNDDTGDGRMQTSFVKVLVPQGLFAVSVTL